ncbi:Late embryogenesis abundant protein-related [Theobroma cacao]|uniref:Late embryogenesis abundant protein-related n=1 Tax=Theobroma cacao TaxID=3641 RepID=A0A061GV26_THECC|nr:Late embryogenesis abundant protein-related [Theobroma cacao]
MKSYILVVFFVILLCTEAAMVHGDDKGNKGNGNKGNGNNKGNSNGKGNGDDDNDNGKGKNKGNEKDKNKDKQKKNDGELDYDNLSPSERGQERAYCKGKGACYQKTLVCPSECPQRKPKKNKKIKACHVNCGSKCEAICKWRKPKCEGYGSLCYDPRFVGGDGVMFYFHGSKDGNFAIVSDDKLQINAHFIGTRPQGRTRDFTWVQALAVMFDTHTLVIAANRVSHWDDNVDALSVRWNGEAVNIPYDGEAEWRTNGEEREVLVERTDDKNSVRVKVSGLVEIDIRVRPIGKEENRVHNYQLPDDDAFAHLETQFKFINLSYLVEGVLGKTYRPDYVSPVKRGVPMPMMGGEDKYLTPSLFSPFCNACRFQRPSGVASI